MSFLLPLSIHLPKLVPRHKLQVAWFLYKTPVPTSLSFPKFCSSVPSSRKELYDDIMEGDEHHSASDLVDRYFHVSTMVHQVLVIQPFIRFGHAAKKDTNNQLMLEESIALVRTLNWKVVDHISIGLASYKKKVLFNIGKLTELEQRVATNHKITAVFVSRYQLTTQQRVQLENLFMVPVIDRYNLVLQIFFQHAKSRDAKLQVALAEIPYLKNRLMVEHEEERGKKHSGERQGEKYFDMQRFVLKKLEGGIKKKIDHLREQRLKLRSQRKQLEVATVAVIGYTNCGKTSLIKAITGSSTMQPKDQLFATLDVTCHGTRLPVSNMEVVFVDTVGFISDIPTPLIASFSSTLEDALHADILLHVVDYSNPDWVHQTAQVLATLKRLQVSTEAMDRMITVGNKIDKMPTDKWGQVKENGALPISATVGYGLDFLLGRIEDKLINVTDRMRVVLKVKAGGEEWEWLHKNTSVGKVEFWDEDNNYNLVTVIISRVMMEKFKSLFVRRS